MRQFSPGKYLNLAPNSWNSHSHSVKYTLPFPENTFDLVRMANLSLCIPYDKWEFVLTEVRRVLAPGGRLELIDDQIFFPYEKASPKSPASPSTPLARPPTNASSFDDDDEDGLGDDDTALTPILDDPDCPTTAKPEQQRHPHHGAASSADADADRDSRITSSKGLETVFGRMLEKKYGIHSRPSDFIRQLLKHVFGRRYASKLTSMHLSLAPRDHVAASVCGSDRDRDSDKASTKSSDSGPGKKSNWISIEWDKRERKACKESAKSDARSAAEIFAPASQIPETISAKAAGRLGITPTAVQAAAAASSCPRLSQTSGLILWPSTYIPVPPSELEMHVCKQMHVLLGCKPALAEYVGEFRDEDGERCVGDAEFQDLIWDYEW